jgi:outer membrane lipoprotein carrier protein
MPHLRWGRPPGPAGAAAGLSLAFLLLLAPAPAAGEEPAAASPDTLAGVADSTRPVAEVPSAGAAALRMLAAAFEKLETFQAEFAQSQEWVGMEPGPEARGTLSLKRPNLFRLEYREPAGHVQVCDGEAVWTYVPENGEVLKTVLGGAKGQGGDFLRWVLEEGTADPAVGEEEIGGSPARVLVVSPPEGLGLKMVRFWIRPGGTTIVQYEVTDSSENRTLYRLLKSRENPKLKAATFRFTPPAGVPVVEVGGP